MDQKKLAQKLKRACDAGVALGVLTFGAPALLAVAAAVRVGVGRPVLFRQARPGLNGRPFEVVKFRTMTNSRTADGQLLPDSRRLTPTGQFLRKLSLDELPQFWNVLRGEMSLVGPRPLLMQYLGRYTPEQARRHDVLPGITGWCQVNGRNALSWEEKFALDVWYVDNWSLWLDAKIVALTFATVFRGRGVSHAASATMPEFLGYDGTALPAPEYRELNEA